MQDGIINEYEVVAERHPETGKIVKWIKQQSPDYDPEFDSEEARRFTWRMTRNGDIFIKFRRQPNEYRLTRKQFTALTKGS